MYAYDDIISKMAYPLTFADNNRTRITSISDLFIVYTLTVSFYTFEIISLNKHCVKQNMKLWTETFLQHSTDNCIDVRDKAPYIFG